MKDKRLSDLTLRGCLLIVLLLVLALVLIFGFVFDPVAWVLDRAADWFFGSGG